MNDIQELLEKGDPRWQDLWKTKIVTYRNISCSDLSSMNLVLSIIEKAFKNECETIKVQGFTCWQYLIEQYDDLNLPYQMDDLILVPMKRLHSTYAIADAKLKVWNSFLDSSLLTKRTTINTAIAYMLKFLYTGSQNVNCASSYPFLVERCARLYRKALEKVANNSVSRTAIFSFMGLVMKSLSAAEEYKQLANEIWTSMLNYISANDWYNDDLVYITEMLEELLNHDEGTLLLPVLLASLIEHYCEFPKKYLQDNMILYVKCLLHSLTSKVLTSNMIIKLAQKSDRGIDFFSQLETNLTSMVARSKDTLNVDTIWRKIIVGFCEWSKVPDNILNEGRKFNLLLEVAVNLFLFPIQHFYGKYYLEPVRKQWNVSYAEYLKIYGERYEFNQRVIKKLHNILVEHPAARSSLFLYCVLLMVKNILSTTTNNTSDDVASSLQIILLDLAKRSSVANVEGNLSMKSLVVQYKSTLDHFLKLQPTHGKKTIEVLKTLTHLHDGIEYFVDKKISEMNKSSAVVNSERKQSNVTSISAMTSMKGGNSKQETKRESNINDTNKTNHLDDILGIISSESSNDSQISTNGPSSSSLMKSDTKSRKRKSKNLINDSSSSSRVSERLTKKKSLRSSNGIDLVEEARTTRSDCIIENTSGSSQNRRRKNDNKSTSDMMQNNKRSACGGGGGNNSGIVKTADNNNKFEVDAKKRRITSSNSTSSKKTDNTIIIDNAGTIENANYANKQILLSATTFAEEAAADTIDLTETNQFENIDGDDTTVVPVVKGAEEKFNMPKNRSSKKSGINSSTNTPIPKRVRRLTKKLAPNVEFTEDEMRNMSVHNRSGKWFIHKPKLERYSIRHEMKRSICADAAATDRRTLPNMKYRSRPNIDVNMSSAVSPPSPVEEVATTASVSEVNGVVKIYNSSSSIIEEERVRDSSKITDETFTCKNSNRRWGKRFEETNRTKDVKDIDDVLTTRTDATAASGVDENKAEQDATSEVATAFVMAISHTAASVTVTTVTITTTTTTTTTNVDSSINLTTGKIDASVAACNNSIIVAHVDNEEVDDENYSLSFALKDHPYNLVDSADDNVVVNVSVDDSSSTTNLMCDENEFKDDSRSSSDDNNNNNNNNGDDGATDKSTTDVNISKTFPSPVKSVETPNNSGKSTTVDDGDKFNSEKIAGESCNKHEITSSTTKSDAIILSSDDVRSSFDNNSNCNNNSTPLSGPVYRRKSRAYRILQLCDNNNTINGSSAAQIAAAEPIKTQTCSPKRRLFCSTAASSSSSSANCSNNMSNKNLESNRRRSKYAELLGINNDDGVGSEVLPEQKSDPECHSSDEMVSPSSTKEDMTFILKTCASPGILKGSNKSCAPKTPKVKTVNFADPVLTQTFEIEVSGRARSLDSGGGGRPKRIKTKVSQKCLEANKKLFEDYDDNGVYPHTDNDDSALASELDPDGSENAYEMDSCSLTDMYESFDKLENNEDDSCEEFEKRIYPNNNSDVSSITAQEDSGTNSVSYDGKLMKDISNTVSSTDFDESVNSESSEIYNGKNAENGYEENDVTNNLKSIIDGILPQQDEGANNINIQNVQISMIENMIYIDQSDLPMQNSQDQQNGTDWYPKLDDVNKDYSKNTDNDDHTTNVVDNIDHAENIADSIDYIGNVFNYLNATDNKNDTEIQVRDGIKDPQSEIQISNEPVLKTNTVEIDISNLPVVEDDTKRINISNEPVRIENTVNSEIDEPVGKKSIAGSDIFNEPVVENNTIHSEMSNEPVVEKNTTQLEMSNEPVVEAIITKMEICHEPLIEENIAQLEISNEPVIGHNKPVSIENELTDSKTGNAENSDENSFLLADSLSETVARIMKKLDEDLLAKKKTEKHEAIHKTLGDYLNKLANNNTSTIQEQTGQSEVISVPGKSPDSEIDDATKDYFEKEFKRIKSIRIIPRVDEDVKRSIKQQIMFIARSSFNAPVLHMNEPDKESRVCDQFIRDIVKTMKDVNISSNLETFLNVFADDK